jgi:hypothetical protein
MTEAMNDIPYRGLSLIVHDELKANRAGDPGLPRVIGVLRFRTLVLNGWLNIAANFQQHAELDIDYRSHIHGLPLPHCRAESPLLQCCTRILVESGIQSPDDASYGNAPILSDDALHPNDAADSGSQTFIRVFGFDSLNHSRRGNVSAHREYLAWRRLGKQGQHLQKQGRSRENAK